MDQNVIFFFNPNIFAFLCTRWVNLTGASDSLFRKYFIQHGFISRPSDSTVSEDAEIEDRTVATLDCQLDALTIRLNLDLAKFWMRSSLVVEEI
jgi:hypothetical protein